MRENKSATEYDDAGALRPTEQSVKDDAFQAHHYAQVFRQPHFFIEPWGAVGDPRGGLVARPSAAGDGRCAPQ